MMQTDFKFVVVSHHTRLGHAQRLAAMLDVHLLIDDGNHGANWNHLRALEWASWQDCRVVIIEDDALPVPDFIEQVSDCLLYTSGLYTAFAIAYPLSISNESFPDGTAASQLIMPLVMPMAALWFIRVTRWWIMQMVNLLNVTLTQRHGQNAVGRGGYMSKLTTLKPRLKAIDTRRIKPVYGEQRRISGSARVGLKRRIYARDGGHCCMCGRVVDLTDSELDHRIALQFGGDNSERNLWTLCTECHAGKSAREVATGQPDELALKHEVPEDNQTSGFVGL